MTHWHDSNPWAETAVYVPAEELAAALAGGNVRLANGAVETLDAAFILDAWRNHGNYDAYILPPTPSGHSVGIRYGARPDDYLSPHVRNQAAVAELFEAYSAPAAMSGPKP
jgi:hypothetical protein